MGGGEEGKGKVAIKELYSKNIDFFFQVCLMFLAK